MVERLDNKLLLRVSDFSPTDPAFEVIGVFNPGAARLGGEIILLVRIAQACKQEGKDWLYSPRSVSDGGKPRYEVDRLEVADGGWKDHRKPLLKDGERRRLAFISHLEMVRIAEDGYTVREVVRQDALLGQHEFEEYGVEDPRITKMGGTYYITYVSVSGRMGVCTSLMSTVDFECYERHGIMFPCRARSRLR